MLKLLIDSQTNLTYISSMIYLGIDPGLDGGLSSVGNVTSTNGIPCIVRDKGKGSKREYNLAAMRELLKDYLRVGLPLFCLIENVHAMPAQGVTSMFSMGFGLGAWHGLLTALEIPFETVTPQRWKKAMLDGTGKDKEASRLRALSLFPVFSDKLKLKKDEGKAEALLIAEYARRHYNGDNR